MSAAIAAFMLVLGNSTEAERRARAAREQPSRHGSSTDSEENSALANGVLHWNALQARLEEMKENGAGGWTSVLSDREKTKLEIESWTTKRALIKLLGDEKFLNECLRPYLPDSPGTETWLMGTIVQILPPGVVVEAIRQARLSESHPAAVAYFDAVEAELELRRDHAARALELARQAMGKLPAEEKLLRGRTAAGAAEAARRQGLVDDCRTEWAEALALFPAASRFLQLAIPVQIEDDGSHLAQLLKERLCRSPRFHADPAGLRVVLSSEGGRLSFALYRGAGQAHFTDSVPTDGAEDEVLTRAVQQFHDKLMSPNFALTAVEINRLGSTAAGAKASAEAAELLKRARGDKDSDAKKGK
jgi:hypothetical protein